MKKCFVCFMVLCLVFAMFLSVSAAPVRYGEELTNSPQVQYQQKFKDVPESYWAFKYIGEMEQRGVLLGYPNGNFYPDNYVTRGEFAKIMTIAAGLSVQNVSYSNYADVKVTDWYSPFIESARYYLSGYVSNGSNLYMPETNALREDIAVALVKLKGYDTTGFDLSILKAMFTDWQSISEGAQKYVAVAVEKGLISGYEDNTFRGQMGITRAEAATLLWRAYQYGNGNKSFEQGTTGNDISKLPTGSEIKKEELSVPGNDVKKNENTVSSNDTKKSEADKSDVRPAQSDDKAESSKTEEKPAKQEKKYKVETVAAVNCDKNFVVDNSGTVYYISDDKVKKIKNGKVSDAGFEPEYTVQEEGERPRHFALGSLEGFAFDEATNTVYVLCNLNLDNGGWDSLFTIWELNNLEHPIIVDERSKGDEVKNVFYLGGCIYYYTGYFAKCANLQTGKISEIYYEYDNANIYRYYNSGFGMVNDVVSVLSPSTDTIYSFNYSKNDFDKIYFSKSLKKSVCESVYCSDEVFYVLTKGGSVYTVDSDGDVSLFIDGVDIAVKDMLPMTDMKYMIMDTKKNIYFYSSGAIRKLSLNQK